MKSEIIALKEPEEAPLLAYFFRSSANWWFFGFWIFSAKYPLGVAVAQLLHGRGDVHYAVFQQPWTMPAFGEP
jgi:hypothetical protein